MQFQKQTVKEAHDVKTRQVLAQLDKIRELVANGSKSDNVNWGDVGSLDYVKTQLQTVLTHYNAR